MSRPIETSGNFIAGAPAVVDRADGEIHVTSPSDANDITARLGWSVAAVDDAVDAARRAGRAWRSRPETDRAAFLRKYQEALRTHLESIVLSIAREVGKPIWEARTEAQAMVAKVDVTIGEGARLTQPVRIADLPGEIRHRPLGVCGVIGPFNFPGHLPNGHIVPALLAGNTVVFKPSEKTPSAAIWIARAMRDAGLPPGVFNVVQGGPAVAEAIVGHAGVDAILFTGSTAVGRKILAANASRPGRLVALELGGKNASIVLDDCDFERTVREIAFSAFVTAGQRCTATSRVYATRGVATRLAARLAKAAKAARVGHFESGDVFLGPAISASSRANALAAIARAEAAGFTALAPSGEVAVEGFKGHYIQPSVHMAPGESARAAGYSDAELFAPDVAIYEVADLDTAIASANEGPFGLVASIYSASRAALERAAQELDVGAIHFNRSTAGASGRLPFGGVKDSGNHRPAALYAGVSSTYPLAVLDLPAGAPMPSWPGIVFDG